MSTVVFSPVRVKVFTGRPSAVIRVAVKPVRIKAVNETKQAGDPKPVRHACRIPENRIIFSTLVAMGNHEKETTLLPYFPRNL
jgi:hypothetical protein